MRLACGSRPLVQYVGEATIDGRSHHERTEPPQLVIQDRVIVFPAASDASPNLPLSASTLIGRDTEISQVSTLLTDPSIRLVTLTGAGGIGKTRLALAVATELQDRMRDGAIFIDLSSVTRAIDVGPAIAQALGLRERTGRDQDQQIVSFLRHKELLLILDNVEQVIDAAPRIARLVRGATGTTFLVTSRAPLRIGGEQEYPVHPLAMAGMHATPEELLISDAGRLFVERAWSRDPAFVVDEQSAPVIAEICARVDGLPLAIELAAARTRFLSPRQLRDRLDQSLELLVIGARDAPDRHLTMRDAIGWSYDLLDPDAQRLFRQLAVFSGGFTLDAIAWIFEHAGNSDEQVPPTLDRLEDLLDQSLVVRDVGLDGEPRLRLLETIRAYGLERLSPPEEIAMRDLHAQYYRFLTQRLRPLVVTESARAPLERLSTEDANLRSALAWLEEQELSAEFAAMVAALSGYWLAYSRLAEASSWIGRAMAMDQRIPRAERAQLLVASGILAGFRGEIALCEQQNAEALPLSRLFGDPFDLAMSLTSFGASRNQKGAFTEASELLNEGLQVSASIVDHRSRAAMTGRALANLSVSARGAGDFQRASSLCEEAVASIRGFGFDLAETRIFMDLAGIAHAQGDLPQVVAYCQRCLHQTGERGDMRVVWIALAGIAGACAAWNQAATAVLLYAASDAVRERTGLAKTLQADPAGTERDLIALRDTLDDDQFEANWDEGRALPLAQVLTIAAAISPADEASPAAAAVQRTLLTRREQDVLRLLAAGQTDREIAEALFIGARTVSWHVGTILGKLGVSTRSQAAIKAHTDGLV